MGHNLESKRSLRQQQSPNAVKEKILSPQAHKSSKSEGKCVILNPFGQLYSDHLSDGFRQQMNDENLQPKSSVTHEKQQLVSKTNKDDELVKHMSNLPGYLQRSEKQKNIQVKALNFGVLDWKRLEKWKYNERMPVRGQPKAPSSGFSLSTEIGKSTLSKTSHGRKQPSSDLHLKSSAQARLSEYAQKSHGKFKHVQDSQTAPYGTTGVKQKDFCQTVESSSRRCPQINHDKGKKKVAAQMVIPQEEALSLDTFLTSSLSMGNQSGNSRITGENDINDSLKYSNAEPQNIVLLIPKCPSKKSSSLNPQLSESRLSSAGQLINDARYRSSDCFSSQEFNFQEFNNKGLHSCPLPTTVAPDRKSDVCTCPCQNDNSVRFKSLEAKCPKAKICNADHPVSVETSKEMDFCTSEQTESRTSSHRPLSDGNSIRYSDCFSSQELQCRELLYEITHSCPLPASVAISQDRESDACTYPFQSDTSIEPRSSEAKCPEAKTCNFDHSFSVDSSMCLDLDSPMQVASKGRHPSPNRRFSFSLGRLSRSFSFKESSAASHLTSTHATASKFGPENSKFSAAAIDDCKKEKANASGRRHPSPFRRLLDPLLKPKRAHSTEAVTHKRAHSTLVQPEGAHSTEAVQTKGAHCGERFQVSDKNSRFVNVQPINTKKPLSHQTDEASTFQALLQLTVKNGLPFFKFVVDNRNGILAAAVKQLPTGKADRDLTYSFYSVHEIKKAAGGWMSSGSKEKDRRFGYNIVGRMKISSSVLSGLDAEDCTDQSTVIESVLYDVDIAGGDKGAADVSPNREISAIIIKEPVAKCNNGESKASDSSPGNTCDQGGKENFIGTTVILPGGFHSLPNKGAPSSLIHRWKSGGFCDCGGWDMGCKLRILTNHNKGSNFLTPAMSCSTQEHTSLFIQGREGKSQPIFSLAPFKDGLYSVEFKASVSLLEAFSICVAVITCRELSDIFDGNNLRQAKLSMEANNENLERKNTSSNQGEVPAKYFSSPPPSPVGRI